MFRVSRIASVCSIQQRSFVRSSCTRYVQRCSSSSLQVWLLDAAATTATGCLRTVSMQLVSSIVQTDAPTETRGPCRDTAATSQASRPLRPSVRRTYVPSTCSDPQTSRCGLNVDCQWQNITNALWMLSENSPITPQRCRFFEYSGRRFASAIMNCLACKHKEYTVLS